MEGRRRSSARWAAAFCVAAFVGMCLLDTMLERDLDAGLWGSALWLLIAAITAAVFTAVLDGPRSLVGLVRGGRQR